MTTDEITALEGQIEVVPIAMHGGGSVIQMQKNALATIKAVTGIDALLENLPVDMPTTAELSRGHWYRRMLVNKATGEVEVEVIPDIYER